MKKINIEERKRIGERIAALRKSIDWTDANGIHRNGMTQEDLAAATGLYRSHIARLERGSYGATIDVLSIIAEALGCQVDFIHKAT